MSLLIAIALAAGPEIPPQFTGKYSLAFAERERVPVCDRPERHYLTITSDSIDWGNGSVVSLISVEPVSDRDAHVWVKEPGGKPENVRLYHFFLDPAEERPLVIIDEIEEMQIQARAPGTDDAGLLGLYFRCQAEAGAP